MSGPSTKNPKHLNEEGKRRTRSQKIGDIGEGIFAVWVRRRGLTANKTQDDYGIDFFCEVLRSSESSETVTGISLAVQVRATEGKRNVVKLDRDDVANALRVEGPFCLVGVNTTSDQVRYKFMDTSLMESFHSFLQGSKKSHSISWKKMDADETAFRQKLHIIASPGLQHRLRMRAAELNLHAKIPGAKISVHTSSAGTMGVVRVPWISQIFEVEEAATDARWKALAFGALPDPGTAGVKIHPALEPVFRLVGSDEFLIHGAEEVEHVLHARVGNEVTSTVVRERRFGDETGYLFKSGLLLTLSSARLVNETYVHQLGVDLVRESAVSLKDAGDDLPFLRMLRPGAAIAFLPGSWMDIWMDLSHLGPAVRAIESVHERLGLSLENVFLADLTDEEFGKSISVLETILIDNIPLPRCMPGFLLGPAAEQSAKFQDEEGRYRVPLVMNLKDKGIVLWIEGSCSVAIHDGLICGFQPIAQDALQYEVLARFEKSAEPEAWPISGWPAIPLLENHNRGLWTSKGTSYPISGDFWLISELEAEPDEPDV